MPAAGLRWMVVGKLAELAHTEALASSVELLFPGPRLAGFAIATGVDLREIPVGLAAGFDYATLYAGELPSGGELVEARFVDRLAGTARVMSPHPSIVRIAGAIAGVPETLVDVRGRLVALSVGDPTPARVVELFAEGRVRRSPSALFGAALSTLPSALARSPLVLYAPGPFTGEWVTGARGLLGAAVALGVAAFLDGGAVRLHIVLTGRFEPADGDRLVSAWTDLAASSMGRLLSLDHPLEEPRASVGGGQVSLDVRLLLMPLASGLRAAVAADVWEILNIPPPQAAPRGGSGGFAPRAVPVL